LSRWREWDVMEEGIDEKDSNSKFGNCFEIIIGIK
jgi:hypothetical protein